MSSRRSFKSDTSFLEKIAVGAIGARQIIKDMQQWGHNPIELERGSTTFKIWKKVKIKRIRVPDILCINCGQRFESRAKTPLELSMSHSLSDPARTWDYGLEDIDYVAFLACRKSGPRPIDWTADKLVQYASVRDLRDAHLANLTSIEKPKGAEEGFEIRIKWSSAVASFPRTIDSISTDHLKYRRKQDGRYIIVRLVRDNIRLNPLVSKGDTIEQNQIVASVIPIARQTLCKNPVSVSYYSDSFQSPSLSKKYAAAKALSYFETPNIIGSLIKMLNNPAEHIYIRLEVAGTLTRKAEECGWSFIKECLKGNSLQDKLEAIIILGELKDSRSCAMLSDLLLDTSQHEEIRAGSAWALGESRNFEAIEPLVKSLGAVESYVRSEAIKALSKIGVDHTMELIEKFSTCEKQARPGIAWALSNSGDIKLDSLSKLLTDEDSRQWTSFIIGKFGIEKLGTEVEKLRKMDPEVYFAATMLWKVISSNIEDIEEY